MQLNYVLEGKTPQEIEKRLQNTPNDTHELYQTCLNFIENSDDYNRSLAIKTLSWLHYSRDLQPMTILQLRQALAFRGDYLEYPDYISSQAVRDSCKRLVIIRGNIVRFTDPGFDEYLSEHRPKDFLTLESLVETCLASLQYALRSDEDRRSSCPRQGPEESMNDSSFNEHAAEFWATYAHQADTDDPLLRKKIFGFLLKANRREELSSILSNKRARNVETQQLPPLLDDLSSGQTALHILIRNGLDDLALLLINSPNEVLDILGTRPNNIEEALRNLGNAISTDAENQTPLHYAASRCSNYNSGLVLALLSHGAYASAKNKMGYTPLHCSAYSGNQRVMEIIMERADLNEKGGDGATALHIAAARGHQHLIEFLHRKGANFSCTDKKTLNPMHYAAAYGQIDVMQFILDQRPDLLNAGPMSPLHKAAEMFQFEALKFLVENDADVMSKAAVDIFNLPEVTPLEIAIRRGNVYAAEDLISKGAHLTIDRNWFRTECRWAHLTGNSEMFMERLEAKCGKASEEWSKTTDEHGNRLKVHQLEHLHCEHESHPALATLLAKEWSDEAYEKIQAACRLFEEYCVVDPEVKSAQEDEENDVLLKISDVVHLKLRCNHCLMYPLRGFRHKCTICPRFDLCEVCYKQTGAHKIEHMLLRVPTLKWLQENHISITEL
jgi:ankyrin repeat protein